MNRRGVFYSVGTGPGDPELLTYQAVKTMEKCAIIALPNSGAAENAVLTIVSHYIEGKTIVYCDMPMVRDKALLAAAHEKVAKDLSVYLEAGQDVAFLTLGDPSIYSTAMYVHRQIQKLGYETSVVAGVPSFCAVAAKLNVSLCEGGQQLHIIPASYQDIDGALAYEGNKVLMKSGKSIIQVKEKIDTQEYDASAVERCGMENEKIHPTLDTLQEDSSYFSVLVVKERNVLG